jgi:hypothetical protein
MMTTSLIAEAVRNQEQIHATRERIAASAHVARNYRDIALPALAAATQRISAQRRSAQTATSEIAMRLAETSV